MNPERYRWFVAALGLVILWFSVLVVVNAVFSLIGGGGDEEEAEEEARLLSAVRNLEAIPDLGPSLNVQSVSENLSERE